MRVNQDRRINDVFNSASMGLAVMVEKGLAEGQLSQKLKRAVEIARLVESNDQLDFVPGTKYGVFYATPRAVDSLFHLEACLRMENDLMICMGHVVPYVNSKIIPVKSGGMMMTTTNRRGLPVLALRSNDEGEYDHYFSFPTYWEIDLKINFQKKLGWIARCFHQRRLIKDADGVRIFDREKDDWSKSFIQYTPRTNEGKPIVKSGSGVNELCRLTRAPIAHINNCCDKIAEQVDIQRRIQRNKKAMATGSAINRQVLVKSPPCYAKGKDLPSPLALALGENGKKKAEKISAK